MYYNVLIYWFLSSEVAFRLSFTLEKRPAASPEGGRDVSRSVEALVTALPLFVIARLSLYLSCSLRVGFHPVSE